MLVVSLLTLAGVWDSSVLTELEEEQWDPVFVSVPDKRRFLDSGELDICASVHTHLIRIYSLDIQMHINFLPHSST